jgi:hypothetical protein
MTWTALPITSAGRFSPLGPRGISTTSEFRLHGCHALQRHTIHAPDRNYTGSVGRFHPPGRRAGISKKCCWIAPICRTEGMVHDRYVAEIASWARPSNFKLRHYRSAAILSAGSVVQFLGIEVLALDPAKSLVLGDGSNFVLLGGAAAAWPLAVRAQPASVPRIGVLRVAGPALDNFVVELRQGMRERPADN